MKILLFIDSLGAGGAQRQLVGLAVMLQAKGYYVKVCTYHDLDFYKHYLDEKNVPNELIIGANNVRKRIFAVRNYFKKETPDWIIAYQETPSLIACIAKLLGGNYKLIVSERNTTQKIGINERVRFFLYHWANVIVPNSYSQESFLAKINGWMKTRLLTISNFVDLEKFYPVPHDKNMPPKIIVVASLWESKNARGLIKASKLLKDEGILVSINWYGLNNDITDYQKKTLKMVDDLDVSDYIKFLPKSKQIAEKYHEADYFCLPSFFEGTPNVICEAMASGLPIICSNVCDNSRYVLIGINGFLFNPNEPESIADSIKCALNLSDAVYQSYCNTCRKIAETKLSKEKFINKYEQILKK